MMRLKEILGEIEKRRPSALGEIEKLGYINSVIRLYSSIIGKSDMQSFKTAQGLSLYPLPEGILPEGIKAVVVDGKMQRAALYEEDMRDNSFMLDPYGFILLSGEKGGRSVEILYNSCTVFEEYATAAENGEAEEFLNQDCGVYDCYAEIIINGALYLMAEADEDINAAINYKARCEELLKHAKQDKYEKRGKYPQVKGTKQWQRF